MSQSPCAGSAAPLPPRSAPVSARSCQCKVRSPERDASLWKAPGEGAEARVRVGQVPPGKLRQSTGQYLQLCQGWGGWGAEAMWVCVSETSCVCAYFCVSGREAAFRAQICSQNERGGGTTKARRLPERPVSSANHLQPCPGLRIRFNWGAL